MKHTLTNAELCKIFGIEAKTCKGFDLSVRHDEFPKLTVHTIVFRNSAMESESRVFDLKLREPAPPPDLPQKELDLDAECAAALKRLSIRLDAAACSASLLVQMSFFLVRNPHVKRDLSRLLK